MSDRRLDNIITHFRHLLTNAVAEEVNNKVTALRRWAAGYRDVRNFKDGICFYCRGLLSTPKKRRRPQFFSPAAGLLIAILRHMLKAKAKEQSLSS